jgi:hypothetical protein
MLLLSVPSSGNAPDVLRVFHAAKRACAKDKDDVASTVLLDSDAFSG